jgi:hypothetical protein
MNVTLNTRKNGFGQKGEGVKRMFCYEPSEQSFGLKDKIIGIDWGKNGDMAVQVTARKEKDGSLTVIEIKELDKP